MGNRKECRLDQASPLGHIDAAGDEAGLGHGVVQSSGHTENLWWVDRQLVIHMLTLLDCALTPGVAKKGRFCIWSSCQLLLSIS